MISLRKHTIAARLYAKEILVLPCHIEVMNTKYIDTTCILLFCLLRIVQRLSRVNSECTKKNIEYPKGGTAGIGGRSKM